MKTLGNTLGLFARLGISASVLLFGQQAMAVGTDAGVPISNTATVDFLVNGEIQPTETSNAADFLVDRRVDFTVERVGSALTPTNVGDTGVFVEFLVTNLSNGTLDFNLLLEQLVTGDGDIYGGGTADTGANLGDVDMANVTISVSAAPNSAIGTVDGPDPDILDTTPYIDDLAEDTQIRVRLYADTPGDLANLDIAGLRLLATAAAPNLVPLNGDPAEGTNLDEDTGNDVADEVDNVFANGEGADGNNNATEFDIDGFTVSSADLIVTKAAEVTDDGFGTPAPTAKAIPGATITYTITLDNTAGAVDATAVAIADLITVASVAMSESSPGLSTITLTPSVGAATSCIAELDGNDDTPTDGCVFGATPDTLDVTGLTVPAGESLAVSFDVTIL